MASNKSALFCLQVPVFLEIPEHLEPREIPIFLDLGYIVYPHDVIRVICKRCDG